jgi:hypothetical protein
MPIGDDINDADVSVQAILEGLGLISSPAEESPKPTSFDTAHNVSRVPETSESTTPSQSIEDTVPRLAQENAASSIQPQCRILHEVFIPPTEAMTLLSTHHVHNLATDFAHPVKSYQLVLDGPPNRQTPFCQGAYDNIAHWGLGSGGLPSSACDFSYAY